MRKTRFYSNTKQIIHTMDIELERKIESLERQRDNALRMHCPLVAKKFQRMIDELAKRSRNNETKERHN